MRRWQWGLLGIGSALAGLGVAKREYLAKAFGVNTVPGIDVSHHQPVIDWRTVKESGRQFAYLKATEGGTFTDITFDRHRSDAKSVGLAVGAYHFGRPNVDPLLQATRFWGKVGKLAKADLHPCLDLEVDDGKSPQEIQAWLLAFYKAAEQLFQRPLVLYTGTAFWSEKVGDPLLPSLSSRPLWLARYSAIPPVTPRNWSGWKIWQHTDGLVGKGAGPVPGIGGVGKSAPCDQDLLYGEVSELQG